MSEIRFGVVNPPLKFYRSKNGFLAGICSGLSESFGFNVTAMRLLWIAALCFYGFGLALYVMLAVSLPRQDRLEQAFNRRLLGVCGKIARKMCWEVGLVRFATILLAFGSFGFAVLAYIVLYFSFEETEPLN
jgi:phage shock protein PspC (stress-responsive transcriptional regulator)